MMSPAQHQNHGPYPPSGTIYSYDTTSLSDASSRSTNPERSRVHLHPHRFSTNPYPNTNRPPTSAHYTSKGSSPTSDTSESSEYNSLAFSSSSQGELLSQATGFHPVAPPLPPKWDTRLPPAPEITRLQEWTHVNQRQHGGQPSHHSPAVFQDTCGRGGCPATATSGALLDLMPWSSQTLPYGQVGEKFSLF